ncbi:MAG: hypothetical protein AAGF92_22720 [Myxococcota bacterium]
MCEERSSQELNEAVSADRDLVSDIRRQWYFVFALLGTVGVALAGWALLSGD